MLKISGNNASAPINAIGDQNPDQPAPGSNAYYHQAWRKWEREAEPGRGEFRDIAVQRLISGLDRQLNVVELTGLSLTSLPEFPLHVTTVKAENNPLSEETIEQLQNNNDNPDYCGPKVSWGVTQRADDAAIQRFYHKGLWPKMITLIHSPGSPGVEEKRLHEENRVRVDMLLVSLDLDFAKISDPDNLHVADINVKNLKTIYKWMPETMAREILNSFLQFIKENISRLNMHEIVKKDISRHGAGHFVRKNTPEKLDNGWLREYNKAINTFVREGKPTILDYYLTTSKLNFAMDRKLFKLALDWGQREEVKAAFLINNRFRHSTNGEEAMAEAKAFAKERYKPIEFSIVNAIAKNNMHNIQFALSDSPEVWDVETDSDNDIEWDSDGDIDSDSDNDMPLHNDIALNNNNNIDVDSDSDSDSDYDIAMDSGIDSDADSVNHVATDSDNSSGSDSGISDESDSGGLDLDSDSDY